ncbi:MAG: hypothetical protein IPO07_16320 [Haliscomenobacter sp.]|nr:hypothetical protein [Haliscomenobacter sp.]MBK9490155.1 hypothetical protein [Haliscomenobacter sp.]
MAIPSWLQVVGRMHPLLLHFPIVLLVIAAVWALFLRQKKHQGGIGKNRNRRLDLLLLRPLRGFSALMGLFLSQEEGYNAEAIAWHKWTGVVVSLAAFGWFTFKNTIRASVLLSRLASGVETYTFKAANEGTIKKLNTNYRVVAPLALGSPALSVDFSAHHSLTRTIKGFASHKKADCAVESE